MFKINQFARVVLFIIIMSGLSLSPGMAQEPGPNLPGEDGGRSSTLESSQQIGLPQDFKIERHAKTGLVRFLTSQSGTALAHPKPLSQGTTPLEAVFSFMDVYGELFGLVAPRQQLQVMRSNNLADSRSFFRFQQIYQDVPVMGAELIVQLDPAQKIRSIQGETLSNLDLDTQTKISPQSATQTAIALVAKTYHYQPEKLNASVPELWIYSPILLGAPGPELNQLVWRIEISGVEALDVRELVLVNAHLGNVALNFSQIDSIKNRLVYDTQNDVNRGLPGTGPVRVEGSPATGIADVDLAYDYAGNTYDFYFAHHQRDSIDNKGMEIVST
ncbi:MAG TPA: hypothetical protein VLM80_12110, partial [Anaerolineales bacterium]|nr:hypothetical protein [Anaerolineales bacterium]